MMQAGSSYDKMKRENSGEGDADGCGVEDWRVRRSLPDPDFMIKSPQIGGKHDFFCEKNPKRKKLFFPTCFFLGFGVCYRKRKRVSYITVFMNEGVPKGVLGHFFYAEN